jgi:hypothetical protein
MPVQQISSPVSNILHWITGEEHLFKNAMFQYERSGYYQVSIWLFLTRKWSLMCNEQSVNCSKVEFELILYDRSHFPWLFLLPTVFDFVSMLDVISSEFMLQGVPKRCEPVQERNHLEREAGSMFHILLVCYQLDRGCNFYFFPSYCLIV